MFGIEKKLNLKMKIMFVDGLTQLDLSTIETFSFLEE